MRSATRNAVACFVGCACLAFLHNASAAPPADKQPAAALQARAEPRPEYVRGEILVKFVEKATVAAVSNARRQIGAQQLKSFPSIGVALWELPADTAVHRGIEMLSAPAFRGTIEYAEPNYIFYISDTFPNDARLSEMWGLHNVGQTGGTFDADTDAPQAWDFHTGSSSVVVGMNDTGIDYLHEDLAANIWINNDEIPGNVYSLLQDVDGDGLITFRDLNDPVNQGPGKITDLNGNGFIDGGDLLFPVAEGGWADGLDDGGNGYVDDLIGWNFFGDDNDPMDIHGHGTHTAGTVGAVGDNGIGVVGVNWRVQLMPLNIAPGAFGWADDAIEAVLYAASFEDENGNKIVRVTSNSWGLAHKSNVLKQAIEASGALFVASAGNSGNSRKVYPAAYASENLISVAATDHNDDLADWSNYSESWVDLGAPGVSILSTTRNNSYGLGSGTSMSAPHVAGVAALVMANDPALDIMAVKDQILAGVDLLPSLEGKTLTGGRLNAVGAVTGSLPPPPDPDTTPPDAVTDLGVDGTATTFVSITLIWTATGDDGMTGTATLYDVRYLPNVPITEANWDAAIQAQGEPFPQPSGSSESFTVTGLLPETLYYLALKVADEVPNWSDLSNVVFKTTLELPPGTWVTETVDTGYVGPHTAITLDSLGNPHISYWDGTNFKPKYANWDGSWDIQPIPDPVDQVGTFTSLAVDDVNNIVHVLYLDWVSNTKSRLRYARLTGSGWSFETLDDRGGVYSSIVLDAGGNPHISWRSFPRRGGGGWRGGGLKYARWTGSQWLTEVVDGSNSAAIHGTSLALDPNSGEPRIAYSDFYKGILQYAVRTGSAWQIELVDGVEGVDQLGDFCSLALDGSGNPHISYLDLNNGLLKYARRTGSAWDIAVVDGGLGSSTSLPLTSLALDSEGNAHISYHDATNGDLKYAHWAGSVWEIEVVDDQGSVGLYSSLALDGLGTLHISYYDATNGDLRYARKQ